MHVFLIILFFPIIGCTSSHHGEVNFADGNFVGSLDSNGKKSGKGIYRWNDGSTYEGDYINDVRSGKGRFLWANGETYQGDYENDERTGKGIYLWPDGSSYEGDFLAGMRHGNGVFRSNSGTAYSGEWLDDLQHGTGVLTYADGKEFKGIWRQGRLVIKPAPIPSLIAQPNFDEFASSNKKTNENNSVGKQLILDSNPQSFSVLADQDSENNVSAISLNAPSKQETQEDRNQTLIQNNISNNHAIDDKNLVNKPEAEIPDWIGTVTQAEATFKTDIINGIDTLSLRNDGSLFSGSMRIVNESGLIQGEVRLLDGKLHGEGIFYDLNGKIIEKSFWSNGKLVSSNR